MAIFCWNLATFCITFLVTLAPLIKIIGRLTDKREEYFVVLKLFFIRSFSKIFVKIVLYELSGSKSTPSPNLLKRRNKIVIRSKWVTIDHLWCSLRKTSRKFLTILAVSDISQFKSIKIYEVNSSLKFELRG